MAFGTYWGAMGIVAVIAFLIGWYILGLTAAVVLAVVIVVLMSVMRIGWRRKDA